MAFPSSIGASIYTSICVYTGAANIATVDTEAEYKALFADSNDFVEIKNIREMPSFGAQPNIVKVPVYGQPQTSSIGAQSDAPDLELTINLAHNQWAAGSELGSLVKDGETHVFQVAWCRAKPANLQAVTSGLGTVENAIMYFKGKIESLLVTPGLSDADTATVALSIEGDFQGFYTQASA